MRSKLRWFTEFCNSHYVSHFAAFFIDTGAKISVVESCLLVRVAVVVVVLLCENNNNNNNNDDDDKASERRFENVRVECVADDRHLLSKGKKEADRRNVCVTSECLQCSAVQCAMQCNTQQTQPQQNRQTINQSRRTQTKTNDEFAVCV